MTTVVHCRKAAYDVYVGRPSKWGNKYSHLPSVVIGINVRGVIRVATREEAVRRHEEDVRSDPELMKAIKRELRGKALGCWCDDPLPCHARTLARIADEESP